MDPKGREYDEKNIHIFNTVVDVLAVFGAKRSRYTRIFLNSIKSG